MNINIDKERKLAQSIGVSIFVSVLLLTMMLAAPASTLFAGTVLKDGTTVTQGKTVNINPPRVAANVDLEPEDGSVTFVNNWYFMLSEESLAVYRLDIEKKWRIISGSDNAVARDFAINSIIQSAEEFKFLSSGSVTDFWTSAEKGLSTTLNPPQGGTESHKWKNCYTLQELEDYKREALRWANYILDVYEPGLKNRDDIPDDDNGDLPDDYDLPDDDDGL